MRWLKLLPILGAVILLAYVTFWNTPTTSSTNASSLGMVILVLVFLLVIGSLIYFTSKRETNVWGKFQGINLKTSSFFGFLSRAGKWLWKPVPKSWPVVRAILVGFGIFWFLLYIAHHTYTRWNWDRSQSTQTQSPDQTEPVTSTSTSTIIKSSKKKLLVNVDQLLKAGTTYVWDKKCRTYYYFEPTNQESATLKCVEQGGGDTITGTIFRNEEGPDFAQTSGGAILDEGRYDVTVDRDIMIHLRVKKKKLSML